MSLHPGDEQGIPQETAHVTHAAFPKSSVAMRMRDAFGADRHPSSAVFDRTGRFYCFTSRLSGNSFDFLCWIEAVSPAEMLRRLRGSA